MLSKAFHCTIALALWLPDFSRRETMVSATYIVVIFSILVQANTFRQLASCRRSRRPANRNRTAVSFISALPAHCREGPG